MASLYASTLAQHRARLMRIADRVAIPRLRNLYDVAHQEMASKLRRLVSVGRGQEFTAIQHRSVMGQIKQGQALLAQRMSGDLGDLSRQAQIESLRGMTRDVSRLEKHFTGADLVLPIEEAARFRGVIDKRRTSLLKMHRRSLARYGSHLVRQMEDQLSLSLVQGESGDAAITRVEKVADVEWWRAERIVRTETSWAFNATHADAFAEAAKELPDLKMRWVELVDDDSHEPLDARVGNDSIAMHGQVVDPGDKFEMPATMPGGGPVPASVAGLVGSTWQFPPNRPNDRATLAPWRPDWGIPAWELRAGKRVPV